MVREIFDLRREGSPRVAAGFALGQVYAFYSWLLWPALIRSTLRQLTERRDWTKTERDRSPESRSLPPAPRASPPARTAAKT
jgi:hypothetical protein